MTSTLERSIVAACDYLLAHQTLDGCWTDWALPPGNSSIWTTAYVGWQLHRLPRTLRAHTERAAFRAAQWLRERQFRDGGWGYNETVGSDADSTAFSILLLDAVHGRAPASAVDHLLRYQRTDGGFSTYRPDGNASSWAVSHADVTPIALLALLPHLGVADPRVRGGIAHVLRQQQADGTWNSFWWSSCWYATQASLALLSAVGRRSRRPIEFVRAEPADAFATALLLSCELHFAPHAPATAGRRIDRLIRTQRPDGGWTSMPMLRVTRRDCFAPWSAANPGPLFADPHRLFTSATALGALAQSSAALAGALNARPQCVPSRRGAAS
jgi:hypothetical protein